MDKKRDLFKRERKIERDRIEKENRAIEEKEKYEKWLEKNKDKHNKKE